MSEPRTSNQGVKPLYKRPVLLFQIRLLNKTSRKLVKFSNALRDRANRLTNEAVRAYRAGKND